MKIKYIEYYLFVESLKVHSRKILNSDKSHFIFFFDSINCYLDFQSKEVLHMCSV